jgi:anhydro-N-acetylmuramic acid kinase
MDGIDAALVELPSNRFILGLTRTYSPEVKARLQACLSEHKLSLESFAQLNTLIGSDFAKAAQELMQKAGVKAKQIEAIGSHGQTLCHDARNTIPYTVQLGCAHTISSMTQTTVVADFRTRDLVNKGQGAPFAPLFHEVVFASAQSACAAVNVGGIANISLLLPNKPTTGWDVGPGNCLMDAWVYEHQGTHFDEGGAFARRGEVITELLHVLLEDPFLALKPPKSIGKEYYSLTWLRPFLKPQYQPQDVQATLSALTAKAIADAMPKEVSSLYLCGGGTHNKDLVRRLEHLLPEVLVQSCSEVGVDPDYLEAMMFAWLAYQTLNRSPVDTSKVTGGQKAILGAVYPFV